jgi:signal recognition particle receptor subunit beta
MMPSYSIRPVGFSAAEHVQAEDKTESRATTKAILEQSKLVFTGCVGSGKTTAIGAVSEVPLVTAEAGLSGDDAVACKKTTTVAMDYGLLTLDDQTRLHLYGTPGQRRFDFMCHILTQGASGLVILINNTHVDPLSELEYYLNLNATFLKGHAAVVGITHYDPAARLTLQNYQACLVERGDSWPVLPVDARNKQDVMMLIHALLAQIEFDRRNHCHHVAEAGFGKHGKSAAAAVAISTGRAAPRLLVGPACQSLQ